MEDKDIKDIEKLLRESANEIKLKPFSEHWPNILKRINEAKKDEVLDEDARTPPRQIIQIVQIMQIA